MFTRKKPYLLPLVLLPMLFTAVMAQPPRQAPPAPVPEAVVMPRPSEAEVADARATLAEFLGGLDADSRRVFDSYPYLLEVRPLGPNTALIPSLAPNFREKHEANKLVAAAGNIDVLFMGDSITDWWRNETGNYAGKPVFDRYFGDLKVANFGIAGDTTQGVLFRLQNGEGEGYSPKAVMLMIGTNNTRSHRAGEIAEGVGAIVLDLRTRFPDAKILLLAIFPRSTAVDPVRAQIAEINSVIARLDDGEKVFYRDIGQVFLDADGNIPREIMSDGLHPTTQGYQLWAEAVNDTLRSLL